MPYATVIIPTHDRFATLATTVASVQRQSVADIEILIVGDGATPEVATIGRQLSGQDPRVRFLEFEKASGAGGANRHLAVADHARSERIFYTDDDDLWLSEHVATLGPALDDVDVVDSLPVSLSLCGRLSIVSLNSNDRSTRADLAATKMKLVYDTHLAHRRSTYLRLGKPWTLSDKGDVVRRMLGLFAADEAVAWRTIAKPTALSLHGGARAAQSPDWRRQEIRRWSSLAANWSPDDLLSRSDPVWHLFAMLNMLGGEQPVGFDAFLASRGLSLSGSESIEGDAPALRLAYQPEAAERMRSAFAAHAGTLVETDRLAAIAPYLLDVVNVATASWAFLRKALRQLNFAQAQRLVAAIHPDNAAAAELTGIFQTYQLLWARRSGEALDLLPGIVERADLFAHEADIVAGEVYLAEGLVEEGLASLRRAETRSSRGSAISIRLAQALLDHGRLDEAERSLAHMETRIGDMPAVNRLRARLDRERGSNAVRAGGETGH